MTALVVRTVPGDPHGYCTVTTTWRPARPGDTPGELVPEHGPTQPVDLATRPGLGPTVPGDQLARCFWCLRPRRTMSDWEQDHYRDGWQRPCKPCAIRRLKNPYNALLAMRKVSP